MSTTNTTNYSLKKWNKGHPNWHIEQQDNADTIDAELKKHQDEEEELKTDATLVAGGHEATGDYGADTLIAQVAAALSQEIQDARGSAGSMDARLDVALNEDGTLKSATAAPDQWLSTGMTSPAYVSASSFSISGDVTAILTPGRPLKIDYSVSVDTFYHVKNATHSGGTTTVTVWDSDPAVINEAITNVYYTSFGQMNIPDKDTSAFTPGSIPIDYIAYMSMGSCDIYYYDTSTYTLPFTEDASRAKTNSGQIARIEYESGLKIGFTYASLNGNVSTVEYRVRKAGVDTEIRTDTYTFDGTTNYLTDIDRA